jgi:hypothetical protein
VKKYLKNFAKSTHKLLGKYINAWDREDAVTETGSAYNPLSPIDNADAHQYFEALNWALEHRRTKNIYNIALTGPYGSGKSSILKTFKKNNQNTELVFLEISLATFKEENPGGDKEEKDPAPASGGGSTPPATMETKDEPDLPKSKDDLLRLIELSILQQIFYHEEDKKIPDSRFKKIKNFKRKQLIWITVSIMAAILFGSYLFFPEKDEQLLLTKFPGWLAKDLHWASLLIFLTAVSFVVFRSIRLAYGLRVSKFKFQDAEIEIDKNISKSILNNHLDEILYFFEVTDYSVVLIEDLDRFRQAEIFTKLRELNLLINNSKKVEQAVVFIYAVRDEMFRDKDRTKFFDFIIPVIPVINSSNSNEKLTAIVKQNAYKISGDLIDDLSFFIDDMRLLYNIMNEYHIYRELLGEELDQDKLLAMIVYKNIYPEDFVALSDGKGILYKLVNGRKAYSSERIKKLDEKIEANKARIEQLEEELYEDEVQLRMIYLGYYASRITGFSQFIIDGVEKTFKEIAEDESLFKKVTQDKIAYKYFTHNYSNQYTLQQIQSSVKFAQVENDLADEYAYPDRLAIIRERFHDRQETLKEEIAKYEKLKTDLRHFKLKEILNDSSAKIDIDEKSPQGLLVKLLLRSGYIDEDYLDYISLFYEGSITKEDRTFLLNVKSQIALSYDFKLQKIGNLIGKIRTVDFQQPYLLNYQLLDYLLAQPLENQRSAVLSQLNEDYEYAFSFIDGYLTNGTEVPVFIEDLTKTWPGFWKFIMQQTLLTKERKREYFQLVIAHAAVDSLKAMARVSDLGKTISGTEDIMQLIPDEEKLKKVITALQIKFNALDLKAGPKKLASFVCDNEHYQLLPVMLERVIDFAGKFDRETFDKRNYEAIYSSGYPKLISYVEKQLSDYLTHVYLKMTEYQYMDSNHFVTLLNNDTIALELRRQVIAKTTTLVPLITELTHAALDDVLLEWSLVEATWYNVIMAYVRQENSISNALIVYLNDSAIAGELSKHKIDKDNPVTDLETVKAFMVELINRTDLSDEAYDLLMISIPYWYPMSKFNAELTKEKIDLLIKRYVVSPVSENFSALKERYPGAQLLLIERSKKELFEKLEQFTLDSSDVVGILKSVKFTLQEKNTLVNHVNDILLVNNRQVQTELMRLIFDHASFKVPEMVLLSLLKTSFPIGQRVKLFNMHYQQFTTAQMAEIFATFPDPFDDIGVRYKSPVIPYGTENGYLANNLRSKNFIANIKEEKKGIRLISFKK